MVDSFTLLYPLIRVLPPEIAHGAGLLALRCKLWPSPPPERRPDLRVKAFGLTFLNPVGLAAGFDKNAVAMEALLGQGFGFIEAGTVTPLPQQGNPRPRIFRLSEDRAVINRLGFNNKGLERFIHRFRARDISRGLAGANIGVNKGTEDVIADYVLGMQTVYVHADYIAVNISSPNTPGLRNLQQREALTQLLSALRRAREDCMRAHGTRTPLLLKVAPDLEAKERQDIADIIMAHGIDGLIIGNTTVSRPDTLISAHSKEEGGLSGRPLFALSNESLKDFYRLTSGKIPLIGVGGISSAEDAYAKIRAGATLVQLYTALVYQGFGIVRKIQKGLGELLKKDGFSNIQQAVGVDVK